jgi:hypothetical protein
MRFVKANAGHVYEVFADLSEISTAEVVAECGNWWKALPKVLTLLSLPNSQTEALMNEQGTALALFGHYPSGVHPLVRTTWFVFSRGFAARGLAVTLACRRRVRALQRAWPNTRFISFTKSNHPERPRWFELLGFFPAGKPGESYRYVLPESGDLNEDGQYNPEHPQAS